MGPLYVPLAGSEGRTKRHTWGYEYAAWPAEDGALTAYIKQLWCKRGVNQSINRSIDQPINRSSNRSNNRSIDNRSIDQSFNSIDRLINPARTENLQFGSLGAFMEHFLCLSLYLYMYIYKYIFCFISLSLYIYIYIYTYMQNKEATIPM